MIERKKLTPLVLAGIFIFMLGLSYAAVPLYDLFCRVTGFGGTTQVSNNAPKIVLDKQVSVRFDTNVNNLPWDFKAKSNVIDVKVGQVNKIEFEVTNYSDEPTSDVLLSIKISNPNETVISDFFITSDSKGEFAFPFELSEDDPGGDYTVNIMSMCREVHRDICTHKTAETTISVIGEQSKIPDWVRNIFVWYAEDSISEKELLQALQYLIKEKIIQVDDVANT